MRDGFVIAAGTRTLKTIQVYVITNKIHAVKQVLTVIDTGSMVLTTRKYIVNNFSLSSQDVALLRIVYSNESTDISSQATRLFCCIQRALFEFSRFRIVSQQDANFTLGIDWLIHFKPFADPLAKSLLTRYKFLISQRFVLFIQ